MKFSQTSVERNTVQTKSYFSSSNAALKTEKSQSTHSFKVPESSPIWLPMLWNSVLEGEFGNFGVLLSAGMKIREGTFRCFTIK